jgi:hypothetical protein
LLLQLCYQLFETAAHAGDDHRLLEQGVELVLKLRSGSQKRIAVGETLVELRVDRRGRGPASRLEAGTKFSQGLGVDGIGL